MCDHADRLDVNLLDWRSAGQPRGWPRTWLSLRHFEVRDFSHALLGCTRESALDRQRRQRRQQGVVQTDAPP
jgi:hypothetical protein